MGHPHWARFSGGYQRMGRKMVGLIDPIVTGIIPNRGKLT